MFKRLAALEKSGTGVNVSFLNTHPASDDRVKVSSRVLSLLPVITYH
jgi:predicted Zn-dependent protease